MNPAIQGYPAAVADPLPAEERRHVAGDLAAVERLVAANPVLHDAMTDVAVPPRARRAVLDELLADRVSSPARRLASYAAGAVRSPEIPAAMAWVAHRFRQLAEDRADPEEILAHRAARERVGGYAAAIFESLSVAELEEVEDELFRFARIVASTPELRGALGDRDLPVAVRREVVDDLIGGKVHEATHRLVDYAVAGGRPRDIVGTLDWLVEQTALARGWRVARVRSGQDVAEDERRRLEDTLARLVGSPVELQVTVDPALLAGVAVEIGDLRLDATARDRLERLREHVLAGGWTDLGFGRLEREAHRERGGPAGQQQGGQQQAGQDRHGGTAGGTSGTTSGTSGTERGAERDG